MCWRACLVHLQVSAKDSREFVIGLCLATPTTNSLSSRWSGSAYSQGNVTSAISITGFPERAPSTGPTPGGLSLLVQPPIEDFPSQW